MTTVVRFRQKPGTEGIPGHVQVQVFVGHGEQADPADITAGLAGELLMDQDEWYSLVRRLAFEDGMQAVHSGVSFREAAR